MAKMNLILVSTTSFTMAYLQLSTLFTTARNSKRQAIHLKAKDNVCIMTGPVSGVFFSTSQYLVSKSTLVRKWLCTSHGLASTHPCFCLLPLSVSFVSCTVSAVPSLTLQSRKYANQKTVVSITCVHCATKSAVSTFWALPHAYTQRWPIGLTIKRLRFLPCSCQFGECCSWSFGSKSN